MTLLRTRLLVGIIRLMWLFKRHTGINPRGLGHCLDLFREEFRFSAHGREFLFQPKCARAFGVLPCGEWNEPETHLFLRDLLKEPSPSVTFVDVGASIGEMVVDACSLTAVVSVIAFEPQRVCAAAIMPSVRLNRHAAVDVRAKGLADIPGTLAFTVDARRPTTGKVTSIEPGVTGCEVSTLDAELSKVSDEVLLLMDVEGAELGVIKGGSRIIGDLRPLIIFEFNEISQNCFTLDQVRAELGSGYEILRLLGDGTLDSLLESTWNCVAVPREGIWYERCRPLIRT